MLLLNEKEGQLYLCHYEIQVVLIWTAAWKWKFFGHFQSLECNKAELWLKDQIVFFLNPESRVKKHEKES